MSVEDLRWVAQYNYGHFTSMRVENGSVHGLGLHLERLDRDARTVFGKGLDPEVIRRAIRAELGDRTGPVTVRVNVFSHEVGMARPDAVVTPELLVTVRDAPDLPTTALRVRSVEYERDLPEVKHVGTFGLLRHRRLARLDGYDDALLLDRRGRISEGTIWNVAFFDGDRVIWPNAPALPGIAMRLVRAGLERAGVPSEVRELRLADLSSFRWAFATNEAFRTLPIASVDETEFEVDGELNALLRKCYEASGPEPV
ncbi:aminotransferase class IV [Allokutzneria oryzae]|uniref:Aminotransferase class IV n=1 Tax=Allokutzneria oryzae TaxID=1378989 RepID=A0ABV5ZQZ5_9PSEU